MKKGSEKKRIKKEEKWEEEFFKNWCTWDEEQIKELELITIEGKGLIIGIPPEFEQLAREWFEKEEKLEDQKGESKRKQRHLYMHWDWGKVEFIDPNSIDETKLAKENEGK